MIATITIIQMLAMLPTPNLDFLLEGKMDQNPNEALYSISEAARLLSNEERTIVARSLHRAVTDNNIPTVLIGSAKAITLSNAKKAANLIRNRPGNPGNDEPRTVKRNPRPVRD